MFSPENQKVISENGRSLVNNLFLKTLSRKKYTAQFDLGDGLRLVSGSPIYLEGQAGYFLNIPTPFSQILSPIHTLLSTEILLNVVLLAAFTAAMIYIVLDLSRWNKTLEIGVKKRTQELEDANIKLNEAIAELMENDKVQRDFINIAAHELRTPVQAIIGYAELLNKSKVRDREYEKTLLRNAARLHRLSTKLLEVARIETKSLMLDKKRFDINDEIKNEIKDVT